MLSGMALAGSQTRFGKFVRKVQVGLILFFAYVATLVIVGWETRSFWMVFDTHLIFVLIFGIIYLRYQFFMFFFAPIYAVMWPIENFRVKRYLKHFKKNIPAETVIVLGHADWFTLEGWIKPIFLKREIKALVDYLHVAQKDFSFYTDADFTTVEEIMGDKNIKEVYFFGHGNSHEFQLDTDEILYSLRLQ